MSERNDGGPAFPGFYGEYREPHGGMTLRDYFAAHSPTPTKDDVEMELRHDRLLNPHNDNYKPRLRSCAEINAALRYRYADALLAAREGGAK